MAGRFSPVEPCSQKNSTLWNQWWRHQWQELSFGGCAHFWLHAFAHGRTDGSPIKFSEVSKQIKQPFFRNSRNASVTRCQYLHLPAFGPLEDVPELRCGRSRRDIHCVSAIFIAERCGTHFQTYLVRLKTP